MRFRPGLPRSKHFNPIRDLTTCHMSWFQAYEFACISRTSLCHCANTIIYKCSFSPRPLGIGIDSQTLLSPVLKVPRMELLSSLLWWELRLNYPVMVLMYDCRFTDTSAPLPPRPLVTSAPSHLGPNHFGPRHLGPSHFGPNVTSAPSHLGP